MTFANEMKDFLGAFTIIRESLGTPESREAERLDNEYRRAQIDYMRSRGSEGILDLPDYEGSPLDYTPAAEEGDAGTAGEPEWGGDTGTAAYITTAGTSTGDKLPVPPKPVARPKRSIDMPAAGARGASAALDLGEGEVGVAGAVGPAGAIGAVSATPTTRPSAGRNAYSIKIGDRTSFANLQPWTRSRFESLASQAQNMGVKLVVTAGGGPGHKSHAGGTELDFYGVHADGSKWTPDERARVSALGARLGFNRFGLYPGMSLHMGRSGSGRPMAMWGAGGRTSGASSRQFTDPADRWLYQNFATGKLFSGSMGAMGSGGPSGAVGASSAGGGGNLANWEAYIRQGARARNMDEDIAVRVAKSEGLAPGVWQSNVYSRHGREQSYGPFQLYTAGGLGNQFTKAGYGDPSDIRNVYKTIDFSLDHAATNGWGSWYGAAKAGIGPRDGLENARAIGVSDRTYTGSIEGGGGGGGSAAYGGGDAAESMAYPESRTKDDTELAAEQPEPEYQESGSKDDVAANDPKIHTVVEGDTLWGLAEKYDLETYMRIVEANPGIVENPDLIYPGEQFVIPVGGSESTAATGAVPEAEGIPDPNLRPTPPGYIEDVAGVGGGGPPEGSYFPDTAGVGGGGPPEGSYFPDVAGVGGGGPDQRGYIEDVAGVGGGLSPPAELQRAQDYRAQIEADTTMEPATKQAMLQALDIKIQQLSYATGGTGSSTPTETARLVEQRPGLDTRAKGLAPPPPEATPEFWNERGLGSRGTPETQMSIDRSARGAVGPQGALGDVGPPGETLEGDIGEPIAGTGAAADMGATVDVPTPPARPARPSVGAVDEVSGSNRAGFATARPGGGGADTLGPAQQSIDEVTNFGQWDLSPSGRVVRPDGREMPDDTFQSGKRAAVAGRGWLSRFFFGNSAVNDNPARAADTEDDAPADNLVRGAGALHKGHMAQVHAKVDAWAQREGIVLPESERNVRSLGMLYDYWIAQGEPEKAQAIAGAALQYYQSQNQRYAALSKALMDSGDINGAVKAMVRGYAQIPDGRDFKITGDPTKGWAYTYTNEETGKEISKGILSPDQMFGMIMNQSPNDMDKFLYRAAGQENMDEVGPELTGALADLKEVPAWEIAQFDPIAAKQMGADDLRIYSTAIDAHNGGVAQAKVKRDMEALDVPTSPTGAGTPAAAGAGGAGTPAATGAVPITPEVTTPGPPDHGFPGGTVVTTLKDGTKVYDPGPDGTFGVGLGEDIQKQLQKVFSMESPQGAEGQRILLEAAEKERVAEVERRRNLYAVATAEAGKVLTPPKAAVPGAGAPEQPGYNVVGAVPEAFEPADRQIPALPGGQYQPTDLSQGIAATEIPGGPVPYQRPTTQEEVVGRAVERSPAFASQRVQQFGVSPPVPPGPREHYGVGTPPAPDMGVIAAIGNNTVAQDIYKIVVQKQLDEYNANLEAAKTLYTKMTAPPEIRKWDAETAGTSLNTAIGNYFVIQDPNHPEAGGQAEDQAEADFFKSNEILLRMGAQAIGELNGIGNADAAVETVAAMISPNPARPGMPMFVAAAHPTEPNLWVVQPLGEDGGAKGQRLLVPKDTFDAIYATWQGRSNEIIAAKPQGEKDAWLSPDREANTASRAPGQPIKLGPPSVVQDYTNPYATEPAVPAEPIEAPPSRAHPVYVPSYTRNEPHPETAVPGMFRPTPVPNPIEPQYPGRGR